jgi:hypothetical protein
MRVWPRLLNILGAQGFGGKKGRGGVNNLNSLLFIKALFRIGIYHDDDNFIVSCINSTIISENPMAHSQGVWMLTT